MNVNRHAAKALIAMRGRLPMPVNDLINTLEELPPPSNSKAIEVCRLQSAYGNPEGTNGDALVLIVRSGRVVTAMLRRTWNQPFTPEALRVDEVERWSR